MFRPNLHSFNVGLLVVLFLLLPAIRATTATNWTNPNARLPSFSSTYLVGERIYLSWQPLNQSTNDLWLIRYDPSENFTLRIASALDLSQSGSFPWTIAVAEQEVVSDTRFMLAFVPTGTNYDATSDSTLDSPAFNLMLVNQNTAPNGTVAPSAAQSSTVSRTTTPTSAASSTSSSSSPPGAGSHLSSVETASIAVGVLAAVGLACFFGGYLVFKRRQSRHKQKLSADAGVDMTGPYSALGSDRAPAEMNAKEASVHEMTSSKDSLAHESDSTPVHEVGNTIKRPGVHEMPG